jgi:hypothetical protein
MRRVARVTQHLGEASSAYETSLAAVAVQAARIYRRKGFRPREAARYGLLDPHVPASETAEYMSRRDLRPLQRALNPEAFWPLTEDKSLFGRYCEELGLPSPATIALLFPPQGFGWAAGGEALSGEEDWCAFLGRHGLPDEIVLKPTRGHFGLEVRLLRRTENGLVDETGAEFTPSELYGHLAENSRYGAWMLQPRVRNHPHLDRLSGAGGLQTLRMITLVDLDGAARLLFSELKIIVGDAVVDNVRGGATGNLTAPVSPDDGTLGLAVRTAPGRFRPQTVSVHPRTGVPFAGFQVPLYAEACALVVEAAERFLPLRSLGWDVALTPDGPVLIEANALWGPPNPLRAMPRLIGPLIEAAASVPGRRRIPRTASRALAPLLRAPGRAIRITRRLRSAATTYGTSMPTIFRRATHARRRKDFGLTEAAILGLLDPGLDDDALSLYTSRTELRPLQDRLNPKAFSPLTEDKGVFYRFCEEIALPHPRLYALFFRGSAGWTSKGSAPASRDDWRTFLSDSLPDEFVLKPARGHRGVAVSIFRREGDRFVDQSGRLWDATGLYEEIASHPHFADWVFQERLSNHPDIVRLSGTDALQCARVITLTNDDGPGRILWAHFRSIGGDAVFDNFRDGQTGNVRVRISLADGTLLPGVAAAPDDLGLVPLPAHPRTGLRFDDFRLPYWDEACALVAGAAPRFFPLRTLGWDIAFTSSGPVVVEANMWWAPPNELVAMPGVLAALAADEKAGRLIAGGVV